MNAVRQRAVQARADGRFLDAAMLWRQVLQDAPDDWRSALELRDDLAGAGLYSEADALFRHAARSMPEAPWLAHYGALFTFHRADLRWIVARARGMLAQRPSDPELHRLLGKALLQQGRWAAAARHLAKAPPDAEAEWQGATARLYHRLGRPRDGDGPRYEIALINLDRSPARYRETRYAFRHSKAPLFRVPGVEGRLLPEPAVWRLAGAGGVQMRGTLGCFLGHVSAWETMLSRGLSHCLVVEDDVVPQLPLPAHLGGLDLPAEYDLCFVNDRLQPRWPPARIADCTGWQAVPLVEAFASFPPEDNAPGTDGYLLSAAGARKLLTWVEEDGFADDVDWRLLTYGLTEADYAALPPGSHAAGVIATLRQRVRRADRLSAYVLHPALTRTVPITSDREDDNRHRRA